MNELLPTDGHDYDIIEKAVLQIKDTRGMTCEIGVRRGGGSRTIIDCLIANNDLNRHHICIDPYGNIDYMAGDFVTKYDYDNSMRNDCLMNIYQYTHGLPVHLHFFVLEDTEFFNRYYDGVPVYDEYKQLLTKYALVHLDGPHDFRSVLNEFNFFKTRCEKGAVIIFDDIGFWAHDRDLEPIVLANGFRLFEKNNTKAAYLKT